MNFVVVGTDHRMQNSDLGFEGLLRGLAQEQYFERLTDIFEEYHENIGASSVAKRLAHDRQLRWTNLDMTIAEKQEAGILTEQLNRPGMFQENVTYRLPSDQVREEAWVVKLTHAKAGTALVICGYLHFESLVHMLRAQGHRVDKRVYLETIPTIKQAVEEAFAQEQMPE
jgi:hypothetical protein